MTEVKKEENRDGDFDLLASYLAGDDSAYSAIIERHSGPLINFLYRYTQDRAASEDIAQEAFLRLCAAAPGLEPGAARLSTILYKIARNLAIDAARKARSRAGQAAVHSLEACAAAGLEPAEAPETAPDALYETAQREKAVRKALAGLPETQRAALILKVYEGRSYAEIAEITGTSLGSVETLLFRARQGLRKALSGTASFSRLLR